MSIKYVLDLYDQIPQGCATKGREARAEYESMKAVIAAARELVVDVDDLIDTVYRIFGDTDASIVTAYLREVLKDTKSKLEKLEGNKK